MRSYFTHRRSKSDFPSTKESLGSAKAKAAVEAALGRRLSPDTVLGQSMGEWTFREPRTGARPTDVRRAAKRAADPVVLAKRAAHEKARRSKDLKRERDARYRASKKVTPSAVLGAALAIAGPDAVSAILADAVSSPVNETPAVPEAK